MPFISVIVPTLNEEDFLGDLMNSLKEQDYSNFEVLVVDGGSKDKTKEIAESYGAQVIDLPNTKEFPSRNAAAKIASGDILLFTGADMIFPCKVVGNIASKFEKDVEKKLLAVAGPGIPYDASTLMNIEFAVYNAMRWFFAQLPKPLKQYSTSTNLLAVRKEAFDEVGGLDPENVNADGMLGRCLCQKGQVMFSQFEIKAFQSARRINEMGSVQFNSHFVYVLENFFPFLSNTRIIKRCKDKSGNNHSKMRQNDC